MTTATHRARLGAERRHRRVRRATRSSATSPSTSPTARSPRSSGPTAAASRRCCAPWPGCSSRPSGQVLPRRRARSPTSPPARSRTRLALLPQSPIAPEGLLVRDLVGRGRHPHQRWFSQWSPEDEQVVEAALRMTDTARPARPPARPALRRPAPARLDRDDPGPGHRPGAARRAHDVPRPRPPGRGARPGHPAQPRARPHRRDGAARPQPRRPLQRPRSW